MCGRLSSKSQAEVLAKLYQATLSFEPGDMVTSVMSFGSLTPIAVRVVGTDLGMVRGHAEKIATEMKKVPSLRDVQFGQNLALIAGIGEEPIVDQACDRHAKWRAGAGIDVRGPVKIANDDVGAIRPDHHILLCRRRGTCRSRHGHLAIYAGKRTGNGHLHLTHWCRGTPYRFIFITRIRS